MFKTAPHQSTCLWQAVAKQIWSGLIWIEYINYMSICRIYTSDISLVYGLVFTWYSLISLWYHWYLFLILFVLRATREPCHLRSPPVVAWARPFEFLPFVLPPAQKSAQLQGDARDTSMKIYLHNLLLYSISTIYRYIQYLNISQPISMYSRTSLAFQARTKTPMPLTEQRA